MKKLIFGLLVMLAFTASAEVTLPYVLSSNMVLQRNLETSVWGWAQPGEKITVQFRDVMKKTKTGKDGKWLVKIDTGKEGGPFDLSIEGKNKIILENILVGDVWVCSGQSNMEWPLSKTMNAAAEVKKADLPKIRLFYVQKNASPVPVDNTATAKWEVCTPETAKDFSAVGYFFGRKIHLETGVPIGLINSNWGGTNIETWTSTETSNTDSLMAEWLKKLKNYDVKKMAKDEAATFEAYQVERKKIESKEYTHPYLANDFNDADWVKMELPALWENTKGFELFDGIIWFRKEVELPSDFDVNNAELVLDKIDDSDVSWVNGIRVGETFNQYSLLRKYTIPKGVLKIGKNILVSRVEDYTGGGGIYGLPEELYITDGKSTVELSGLWKMKADPLATPRDPDNLRTSAFGPNDFPTLLFNGMIHPLLNYAIKGAVWYQGETNGDSFAQALRYDKQMKMMITDWRKNWNNNDLSFYMVQLANYKGETMVPRLENWPFVREAQFSATQLPKVGMACIIDIGNPADIHPTNKQDVGLRLALNSLHTDYGKDVVWHGPRKAVVKMEGNKAVVVFDTPELVVKNKYGYINGFAVAGDDEVFHYAQASKISDNEVEVSCDKVGKIAAVRFLWSDNPGEINLYSKENLPAEPFRTDNWEK